MRLSASGDAMIRAISYLRVSTQQQGVSGLGMEAQRATVLKHLEGIPPIAEFVEVESGRKKKRPQLEAAIAECKKLGAVLVVAKLDRLARNAHFLLGVMDSGIEVQFCDIPEISGPMGRCIITVLAAVAELESGMISQRTKDALAAAKARGIKLGTASKQLAKKHKKQALRDAKSMKPVFAKLAKEGITSRRKISATLNERGIQTPGGSNWYPTTVSRMLGRLGIEYEEGNRYG